MKKILVCIIAVGTLSAFAKDTECHKAFDDFRINSQKSAGEWDSKFQTSIIEHDTAEVIDLNEAKRDAFLELSHLSKVLAKKHCKS